MAKNELLDKLMKAGKLQMSSILKDSVFATSQESVVTDLPILNIAFSGKLDGGLCSGVTVFAGQSKSFKTLLGLYCMKAYLDKYEDAVALFYDSEFGSPASYFQRIGIDTSRVLELPICNVEELKFDIVSRLEQIERGNKVFILIDSLGNLASKREYENAINENGAKDMSRAGDIKSVLRIITPHIAIKDIPCVIINHTYQSMGLFPTQVVSGGSGVIYAANTIFIINRSQLSGDDKGEGYKFTINIEKSRFVKEKSKLPFEVMYHAGVNKYSGLFDLAVEGNFIATPSKGWYSKINPDTGEVSEQKLRKSDIDTPEFYEELLKNEKFKQYIQDRFSLVSDSVVQDDVAEETPKKSKKKLLNETSEE